MDEDLQALLDMQIGNTIALATLMETMVNACLIDRASLVEDLRAQEAMMQNECQAQPIGTIVRALEAGGEKQRGRYPHLVLVQ